MVTTVKIRLLILLIASAFMLSCKKKIEMKSKPNVLMIVVDDLRPELGAYGNQLIKSPNIDKLAAEGVVFKNAFCNIPVCGASRASLLTGTRPTRFRFLTHLSRADQQVPGAKPLNQLFKENGYQTISNGKVFHVFDDHAAGWDENWRLQNKTGWSNYVLEENIRIDRQDNGTRGPAFESADVSDDDYFGGKLALKTIEDLKSLKESGVPFFLAAGFVKPHLPFNAPKKYWDLYEREDFNPVKGDFLPLSAPSEAFHNSGELRNYHRIPKKGPVNDSVSVTLQHGYYACVSYTDHQIGRILTALDELDLRKNTIVILWGDHGWNLGEHGLWCKHSNFNTSLAAPLIISAPGMSRGEIAESMAEFIDVYPTLADLAGLGIPASVEGKSLVPVLKHADAFHKDFVISKWGEGLTLRSQKYAYTEWRKENDSLVDRMLYDHMQDPDEMRNLANDPGKYALMDSLSQILKANRGKDYFVNTSKID